MAYKHTITSDMLARDFHGISASQYLSWCRENNFIVSLTKTPLQFHTEARRFTSQRGAAVLQKYVKKDLRIAVKKYSREHLLDELRKGGYGAVSEEIVKEYDSLKAQLQYLPSVAMLYLDVVKYLAQESDILDKEKEHPCVLRRIVELQYDWIRSYRTWSPKTHNTHKQLSSFLRHMFAKYDVPLFMDSAFSDMMPGMRTNSAAIEREWFIHIGRGNNIRTAKKLPFPLTKKMAHHFLEAPDRYSISEAFLWGEVLALGGNVAIAKALCGTGKLTHAAAVAPYITSERIAFDQSLIKFFIENPMLDKAQYGPVLDYIWSQKYTPTRHLENGVLVETPPPQPNFSMTGRNATTLMRNVDEWQHRIGKQSKNGQPQSWKSCSIDTFVAHSGSKEHKKVWRINELCTHRELLIEGNAMKHCVGSYAWSCAKGSCSIWSLTMEEQGMHYNMLTIELSKFKVIEQIRGKYNRYPTKVEIDIINLWCKHAHISLGKHILMQG